MTTKFIFLIFLYVFAQSNFYSQSTKQKRNYRKIVLKINREIDKIRRDSQKKSESGEKVERNGTAPTEYFLDLYKKMMNPSSGIVETYKLKEVNKQIKEGKFDPKTNISLLPSTISNSGDNAMITANSQWVERGPYSVGGRTRAIMFDPNDSTGKKVFAGGVSGGLWVNNDITDPNSEWKPINDFMPTLAISCIVYDPNNPKIFYAGTGEVNANAVNGDGIFKSTDGGITWTHIFSIPIIRNNLNMQGNCGISDIKVRNNNGVSEVYVGVATSSPTYLTQTIGFYQTGLYKSTDGGVTFTKNNSLIASTTNNIGFAIQRIEIGADNSVWVSTMYSSAAVSGGRIFKAIDGNNFTKVYDIGNQSSRVEISLSKTNPLKAYALMVGSSANEPTRIIKTVNGGISWSGSENPASNITLPKPLDTGQGNDFTRGQYHYNLVIKVDPDNDENVYVGGIDLYRSFDGAKTWSQFSSWYYYHVNYVHADQHAIVFNPKNTNQILFGNDGGISFGANKSLLSLNTQIPVRNKRYNVTQFYSVAINPTANAGNERIVGGTQDNGNQYFTGTPNSANFYTTKDISGGDGGGVAWSADGNNIIYSYVGNVYYRYNVNSNTTTNLIYELYTGKFINPMAFDKSKNILFTVLNDTNNLMLYRIANTNATPLISKLQISAKAPFESYIDKIVVSPYSTTSTTLLVASDFPNIYKITNADTNPTIIKLNTPFQNTSGSISSIQIGANENEIMVTFYNYGVVSVWYTNNGGTTWQNKENNLPDIPVFSSFINPDNRNEVLLGTELGVWGTTNFLSATPIWAQYTKGIGNVRVTDFDYRQTDKRLVASTYGRGIFTAVNSVLSTSDLNTGKSFKIYPNPSKDIINFSQELKSIEIYSMDGKRVLEKMNAKNVDISKLPIGTYIIKGIDVEGNKISEKIIKE